MGEEWRLPGESGEAGEVDAKKVEEAVVRTDENEAEVAGQNGGKQLRMGVELAVAMTTNLEAVVVVEEEEEGEDGLLGEWLSWGRRPNGKEWEF